MSFQTSRKCRHFGFAVLFVAAAGCGGNPPAVTGPETASSSATVVHVVSPVRATLTRTVSQPGTVEAFEHTQIYAKVPGYVQKWHADIGDVVRKDQLLAELWIPELVSELNRKTELVTLAEKTLAMADAQVVTARAQIAEATAGLARAKSVHDYWKGQSEAFAKLVTQNSLDKQSLADAENQYRTAAAALTEADARIVSAKAMLLEKQVARDKAVVDIRAAEADRQHQADLVRYGTFLAPYDGVVTRKNINLFDFVQPPSAGKGEPLYVIERRDLMRIFVEVPEADAVWVGKGARARVRVPFLQGREYPGTVARTSFSHDPKTRTLLAEIDLANPEVDLANPQEQLRPGMYAYATIESRLPNVLTLPASAVLKEGDVNVGYQMLCYMVEDGRAKRTQIEVGYRNDRLVEVIRKRVPEADNAPRWDAFTGTEQVVSNPSGLKDGDTVTVGRAER